MIFKTICEASCNKIKMQKQIWREKRYVYTKPRQTFGLLILKKGKMYYNFKGKTIILEPCDVIFLPKNCIYEVVFEGNVETYLVNFDMEATPCELEIITKNAPTELFSLFENGYAATQNNDALYVKSLFYLILHKISKHMAGNKSPIERGAEILHSDFNISVKELSKNLSMSQSSFQNKFREKLCMTPSEYRINCQIEKARSLLKTTDIPLKDIALNLGFCDTSYFHKTFKKKTGFTPNEYRKKHINSI